MNLRSVHQEIYRARGWQNGQRPHAFALGPDGDAIDPPDYAFLQGERVVLSGIVSPRRKVKGSRQPRFLGAELAGLDYGPDLQEWLERHLTDAASEVTLIKYQGGSVDIRRRGTFDAISVVVGLTVRDPLRLAGVLRAGIGSARAYGFGLLFPERSLPL